jgi:hypothetical protein
VISCHDDSGQGFLLSQAPVLVPAKRPAKTHRRQAGRSKGSPPCPHALSFRFCAAAKGLAFGAHGHGHGRSHKDNQDFFCFHNFFVVADFKVLVPLKVKYVNLILSSRKTNNHIQDKIRQPRKHSGQVLRDESAIVPENHRNGLKKSSCKPVERDRITIKAQAGRGEEAKEKKRKAL